jgi:hypothetical protein
MAINYVLQRNEAFVDQHQCIARVRPSGTADMEAILDYMMQTATVAKPDVVGVLEGFFSAIEYLLLDGKNVVTPIAVFRSAIRGLFADEADGYEPDRHLVHAAVSPGARLRRTVRTRAQVNKLHAVEPAPAPKRYTDVETGLVNGAITPGGQAQLLGLRLRFDPDDPQQGIFFIAADKSEVRAGRMARNVPGELIFVAPALPAGDYTLQVRASFNDNGDVRAGALKVKLTVNG